MILVSDPKILPSFAEVVDNIRNNHPEGLDQLYRVLGLLSVSLRRQVGYVDFEDWEHDIFIVVVTAIREGRLRKPEALASYIHGIAHLALCTKIAVNSRRRRLSRALQHAVLMRSNDKSPEQALADRDRMEFLETLLGSLKAREREVLTRFYLQDQSKTQICEEMNLTETQFRLVKCRAKQHLSCSALR